MGWLIDLAKVAIPGAGATGKSLEGAPDPLPPLSRAAEARRRRVLALLARDGGQYAVLVEDPNPDPIILSLATPDGTCEVLIPKDRYDPFKVMDTLKGWERETAPLWGRVAITEPGGQTVEVDSPSGCTITDWQAYAERYHGHGCAVTPIAGLTKPPGPTSKTPYGAPARA